MVGVSIWLDAPSVADITAEAEARGVRVVSVATDKATDKKALLAEFAHTFGFGAYFGGNWDAFEECLGDYDPGGAPTLVVWSGWETFAAGRPAGFATAVDILDDAVAGWRAAGHPVQLLLVTATARLSGEVAEAVAAIPHRRGY